MILVRITKQLIKAKVFNSTSKRFDSSNLVTDPLIQSDNKRPLFITTPIFYVNGDPHIGHLFSVLLADALNRFYQLLEFRENIFSVGTDEHGIKVQRAAEANGVDPKTFCDENSLKFKSLFEITQLTNTHFVRTTDENHKRGVAYFWKTLYDKNLIYKSTYSGWYSVVDESFVPELSITTNENGQKISEETGNVVELCHEENYLFRMSEFNDVYKDWLNKKLIIKPDTFYSQLQNMVAKGLNDISVSRPKSRLEWGIEVPGDKNHIIYVWLDALVNYLTVAGYPNNLKNWPPDCQVIGKDILKFHAIYWPIFLIAAGLEPPKSILCHSHWTVDDIKMSKSKGNVIDPFNRIKLYSNEGLRYFLLREGVLKHDGNYNDDKVKNYLNNELADTLGNLLSRCTAKALNKDQVYPREYFSQIALEKEREATELISTLKELPNVCKLYYEIGKFYRGIGAIMDCLRKANLYFAIKEPWKLVKNNECKDELFAVLYINLEVLRVTSILLQPIVPQLSDLILTKLNIAKSKRLWKDAEKTFTNEHASEPTTTLNDSTSKVYMKLK